MSLSKADREMGQWLRNRRLECKLSQTDVAHLLGLSFQQIQKYERGVNRLSAVQYLLLVKLFGAIRPPGKIVFPLKRL